MVLSVISSPTKAFESAFHNPRLGISLIVVLLAAAFFALASFLVFSDALLAAYFFIASLIQWLVFSVLVWFFEFVHVRKRSQLTGTNFFQIASVTSKLWTLNLASSILLAVIAFLLPRISEPLLTVVFAIVVICAVVLLAGWIVGSIKMLKVVTGASRARLFVNWLILIIINSVIVSFITLLLTRAVPF